MSAEKPAKSGKVSVWVASTYFAEGLPYMLVRVLSGVYFTDIGIKEATIGYLNWLGVPWNFKFTWAPLVDWLGTKRRWLIGLEVAITLLVFVLAGLTTLGPAGSGASSAQPRRVDWGELATVIDPITGLSQQAVILSIIVALIVLAVLAATHDVAIDAYYIEAIPDRTTQAAYSGMRALWYRVAVIFARSGLVALPTWLWGFGVGGAAMAAVLLFHVFYLPRVTDTTRPAKRPQLLKHFASSFRSYLDQPKVGTVLAFIITYKLGDEIMFAMNSPFLLRELMVTKAQYAWLAGWIGTFSTIAGGIVASWYVKKVGYKRAIWPLTLGMNLNIWVYVWLAWTKPLASDSTGMLLIAVAHAYEMFAAGLGNTALLVFILYTCKAAYKAAHYAVGSAIMSIGGTFIGGFAGVLVERMGYANLYMLAFAASVPAMLLMPRALTIVRDDA